MTTWQDIATAPRDREIELRVKRKAFRAKWDFVCWQSAGGDDDVPCHAWCATTDDYPSDWDEGVCWLVNGDGRRSSRPSAWRELASPNN